MASVTAITDDAVHDGIEEVLDDIANRYPWSVAIEAANSVASQAEYAVDLTTLMILESYFTPAAGTLLQGTLAATDIQANVVDASEFIGIDTSPASGGTITVEEEDIAYTAVDGPPVSFTGGGGSGAAATCVLAGGAISGFLVTNGGGGYTSAPTVVIGQRGGVGASAAATAIISNGSVVAITVTNAGTAYIAQFTGLTRGYNKTFPVSHAAGIAVVQQGISQVALQHASTRSLAANDPNWMQETGVPVYWYSFSGIYGLHPAPVVNGIGNIYNRVFVRPPALLQDTDTVDGLRSTWYRMIGRGAAARIGLRYATGEDAKTRTLAWETEFNADLKRFMGQENRFTTGAQGSQVKPFNYRD